MAADLPDLDGTTTVGVVGLGYVGLPLAIAFSECFVVYGFDNDSGHLHALQTGDIKGIVDDVAQVLENDFLYLYTDLEPLEQCQIVLVTVPTPITPENNPDLRYIREASETIGKYIQPGSVVIFESTVYPGVTEDVCVAILEENSGLTLNEDFYVGYSPERMNPGDSEHRLDNVVKVTSGSTPQVAEFVAQLYEKIVHVGVHRAPSIKVAEAAKVIENIQRDMNIAVVNEFAQLFHHLGLDSGDILEAAQTKWNFLPFKPGLVGGHCIGVDPYYLTYKAKESGYSAEVILAGREKNNSVPLHIARRLTDLLADQDKTPSESRFLVMGLTFKENLSDTRNSKAIELAKQLAETGGTVHGYDPHVTSMPTENFTLVDMPRKAFYDAIIVAVAHERFLQLGIEKIRDFGIDEDAVLFDVQHVFPRERITTRL